MAFGLFVLLISLGLIEAKVLQLSCGQVRKFVDGHNARRLQVAKGYVSGQPAAAEMKEMIWDEELANKAAKWAANHKFQHNPDKSVGSRRFTTGENIYMYFTTDFDYNFNPDSAIESWFSEHKDYTFKSLESSDFGGPVVTGHYTQLVWSDSTYIGCAISHFHQNKWNKYLVVCNYGPAGNFEGQEPYPAGRAAGRLTCDGNCRIKYGNKCRSNL